MNHFNTSGRILKVILSLFASLLMQAAKGQGNLDVSITTASTNVCAGTTVAFNATATGTGSNTYYQWTKNGAVVAATTVPTYTTSQLANGDVIDCIVNSTFGSTNYTATSNDLTMTVTTCSGNTTPTITSFSPSTNICQGGSIVISFTASGYNAGNVFTAQLSNVVGGFSNPVSIGTYTGTSGGTFTAVLPIGSTVAGTGYRVRIVSSSPAVTGPDNGSNFTVIAAPTAAQAVVSATTNAICPGGSTVLSVPNTAGLTYQWLLGTATINGATAAAYTATATGGYTAVVSNAQGCSRTSAAKNITQAATPTANISPASTQTAATGQTVTFSVNATSGASYQWYNNGTAISGATGTAYVASVSGSYSVVVTNSSGCATSSASVPLTVGAAGATVTIGTLSQTSFCQGVPVSVPYTATGTFNSGNVFTAQLSDAAGSFTSPTTIGTLTATGSGTINAGIGSTQAPGTAYRIRVVSSSPAATSAANTGNLTILAMPTDAQMQVSPSGNISICAGNTATLSVPNTAGFYYQWQPATGTSGSTASTFTTGTAGTYTVTVTTSGGCVRVSAAKVVTVMAAPTVTISPSGTQSLCSGPVALTATGNGTAYMWYKNGVATGATTASYTATTAGSYTVVATNASGCTTQSPAVLVTSICPVVITNTGTASRCEGDTITASFNASGFDSSNVFYLQLSDSSGNFVDTTAIGSALGSSATGIVGTIPYTVQPGNNFRLRVVSSSPVTTGPASALIVKVRGPIYSDFSLCAVTVDSATGKNKLVWNKPQDFNIDSFTIYRMNSIGLYTRIGAVPYTAYSAWIDSTSDPKALAQSYYMKLKNTCGETDYGYPHRTIHLNINKGTDNNTWNLMWNAYEGFQYTYFNIYRGTSPTNMQLLRSIDGYSFSFTDYTAPAGAIYYKVTVADGPVCNPAFRTTGGGGMEVASNIATGGPGSIAANWVDMAVYPNPGITSGTLFIQSSDNAEEYTVHIMDVTGRLLQTVITTPNVEASFGSNLAAGLYTVDAVNAKGDKHVVKKWVKQ